MSRTRLLLAFAVSPLAPGVIAGIWAGNAGVTVVFSAFSYPFALVLGIPTYFAFRRLGLLRLGPVLGGSIVLGLIALVAAHVLCGSRFDVTDVLIFAGCAGLVGLVFCLIAFTGVQPTGEIQSSN